MKIVTLTHKHTNCFLVQEGYGFVMYDAGWADSFPVFMRQIKEQGIKLADIKYLVVSHFHPDHAGLTQTLCDYGIKLLLLENQLNAHEWLNDFFYRKPSREYKPIIAVPAITTKQSRQILRELGIGGEITPTPGHSYDSVSLVVDNVCAFTGDLPRFELADGDKETTESYRKIRILGATTIYPAHGNNFSLTIE